MRLFPIDMPGDEESILGFIVEKGNMDFEFKSKQRPLQVRIENRDHVVVRYENRTTPIGMFRVCIRELGGKPRGGSSEDIVGTQTLKWRPASCQRSRDSLLPPTQPES